jgi:ubiquinone/menaquinone biosynthesis C-methylase UbiE
MRDGSDRVTDLIRHHWDRRARTFDAGAGHGLVSDEQLRAWLDLLSRLAGEAPWRVLDVGCGTGFLALRFAELGHAATGIDLSPQMIDQARRNAERAALQIEFRVGNATALDFDDKTFDLVIARHVIWNLPDPERGVAEWLRVLRPGGRLALIEGKWGNDDARVLANVHPALRALERVVGGTAALFLRGGWQPRRLLSWKYRRLEVQLPFSGGPPATQLAEFLEAHSVRDVVVEPLMDPTLWGVEPLFFRYLALGTRSPEEVHRGAS